jgi:hypothetical protein
VNRVGDGDHVADRNRDRFRLFLRDPLERLPSFMGQLNR